MTRYLAFILALIFASISVASACSASGPHWLQFTLQQDRSSKDINATFEDSNAGGGVNQWSSGFTPTQLTGLDVMGFRARSSVPIRFAIVREAGRLDCSGSGGNSRATGSCSFAADPTLSALLESRGIGRPTQQEAFTLMAVDAHRELIDALAQARFPTPRITDVVTLSAREVNGGYIRGLAQVSYRPTSLDSLVQFKALGITPEYIGGFARLGYRDISPDQLVQLKALDITPEFVAAANRHAGSPRPVTELVNRKIFGSRD